MGDVATVDAPTPGQKIATGAVQTEKSAGFTKFIKGFKARFEKKPQSSTQESLNAKDAVKEAEAIIDQQEPDNPADKKLIDDLSKAHQEGESSDNLLKTLALGIPVESVDTEDSSKPEQFAIEHEVAALEKELGIETERDRIVEASLLVDKKFVDTAAISGHSERIATMFGLEAWSDWMKARLLAKKYNGELTEDFIADMHRELAKHTIPEYVGKIRSVSVVGGDYQHLGQPTTYTQEQIDVIQNSDSLLAFHTAPDNSPTEGLIVYPGAAESVQSPYYHADTGWYQEKYKLSDQATAIFEQKGRATEALIKGLLTDTATWYNAEKTREDHDPYELAAGLQQRVVSIHPFNDVNGRLSRLLMDWSLENDGVHPSILEEPSNDILTEQRQWAVEVKKGSEQYAQLQDRKVAMAKAEVENPAELLDLEDERTFYQYIYSQIQQPPDFSEGEIHNHQEYEGFLTDLRKEYQKFQEEFTAESDIEVERNSYSLNNDNYQKASEQSEAGFVPTRGGALVSTAHIRQGGLIPEGYIKLFNRKPTENLRKYIEQTYFIDENMYRGVLSNEYLNDESILSILEHPVGFSSGYLPLKETGVDPMSSKRIPNELVAKTIDEHNSNIAKLYLRKRIDQNTRIDYYPQIINAHTKNWNHFESPFVSATTALMWGEAYAMGYHLFDGENAEENHRYGLVFTSRIPKEGVTLTFGANEAHLSEIPVLRGNPNFWHHKERELLIPGGIEPSTITKIDIFDRGSTVERRRKTRNLYDAKLVCQVSKESVDGKDRVIIINYQNSPQGEKKMYRFNDELGKYQVIDTNKPQDENESAKDKLGFRDIALGFVRRVKRKEKNAAI